MNYFKRLNCLMVIGDQCKYKYVNKYLCEDDLNVNKDKDIFIIPNDSVLMDELKNYLSAINREETFIQKADIIPYASWICLPNIDIMNSIKMLYKTGINIGLLLTETFPYGKAEYFDLILQIMRQFTKISISVCLLKSDRKFGYTDMTNEEQAMRKAESAYKAAKINNIYYEDKAYYEYKKTTLKQIIEKQYEYKLTFIEQDIKDFNNEYQWRIVEEYQENYLNEIILNDICTFEKIKMHHYVYKAYFINFTNHILGHDSILYQMVLELYRNMFSEIRFWDITHDCTELKKEINQSFSKSMDKYLKRDILIPKNELEYRKLMSKSKSDRYFKKHVTETFLSINMRKIIIRKIQARYQMLKKGA